MDASISRSSTGWYKVTISESDSEGSASFSTSFQTLRQAQAFLASLELGSFSAMSVENEPQIDHSIDRMMRSNRNRSL